LNKNSFILFTNKKQQVLLLIQMNTSMLTPFLVGLFLVSSVVGFQLTSQFVSHRLSHAVVDSRTLDLYSCDITSIDKWAFRNATAIVSLDLSHNDLEEIQAGTFEGLYSLKELNLGKLFSEISFFRLVLEH